jgi:hypothetical protein
MKSALSSIGAYLGGSSRFWDDYNQYLLESAEIQSQLDSVTTRYRNDQNELAKLKATNVYSQSLAVHPAEAY